MKTYITKINLNTKNFKITSDILITGIVDFGYKPSMFSKFYFYR